MTKLILLPGWGLGPAALQPLVAALDAEAGLSVELAALPALTTSDPAIWLDELDARLPSDCWLGGWSLGGMLAVALAARRGKRCAGLVTLASNARFVADEHWPNAMAAATFAAFRAGCAADAAATLKRFAMLCAQGCAEARALSPIRIGWIGVGLSIRVRPSACAPARKRAISAASWSRRQLSLRSSSRLFSVAQATAGGWLVV